VNGERELGIISLKMYCKNCRGRDGLVGGVNCLTVNAAGMKARVE